MAVEDERSGRGRMDRSLDEIAAEMHSDQHEVFGRGYEHRELGRMTHRERESRRYEPYSSRRDGHDRGGPSWRDRERDDEGTQDTRIFVANLNYSVSWQRLKDHMKRGEDGMIFYKSLIMCLQLGDFPTKGENELGYKAPKLFTIVPQA